MCGYARLMPNEEEVLTAIREVAATKTDRHAELSQEEVARQLECSPSDENFQRYLARAATTGLIEPLAEVDQLLGPLRFRLVD